MRECISSTDPHLRTFNEWDVFDTFQIHYCALDRQHEQLIQAAADSGAGVIVRGGVARGEPGAGLGEEDRWATREQAGLESCSIPARPGPSSCSCFTNAHPGMNTNIVGTAHPETLAANVAAAARPLRDDTYVEAKRRLDGVAA